MLFAIDADGVPSIAETVLVGEADSRLNGENLLVAYDFIEGSGSLIRDTSGNENDGQIIEHDNNGNLVGPGNFWSADGLSGNALEMDGMEFNSNSIVEISNSPTIGAALTNEITVMAWVNRNVDSRLPDGKIPNVAVFTHAGELDSGYSSFFMGYHADEYKLEFFTDEGSAIIYHNGLEDQRYTPGVWEHLVGTYDGSMARLYVNGKQLDSTAVNGNLIINTAQFPNNVFTLSGFYDDRIPGVTEGMPAIANGSGITDELDGRMDNFKLYNIALTEDEIKAIYNKEYKIEEEEDPCDDYYLVYEIGENSGSGSKEIKIREGDTIRLTLNDENVDYVVTGPNDQEIPDGLVENITESGVYTVTALLNALEAVQDVTIHDFCSQETAGRAHQAWKAIDESIMSYWHTLWNNEQDSIGAHNHFIDLDLGEDTPITELRYLPRPADDPEDGDLNWLNGTITEYNIFVSSTIDAFGDVAWGSPIDTGTWAYSHDLKIAHLGGVIGRYVRLEAIETREGLPNDTSAPINRYASAADIRVMRATECVQTLEINVVVPKIYTFNDGWSANGDPSIEDTESGEFDDIIIESGVAEILKSTSARNITVAPGAALTVNPNTAVNLSVRNTLTLNSDSTSYASLIETGYLTGTVIYNRYVNQMGTSAGGGNDLISAPVAMNFDDDFRTANAGVLPQHPTEGGVFAFAPFNRANNAYENFNIGADYSGSFTVPHGVGYRAATVGGATLEFRGKPTKSIVNVPITALAGESAWNLIGNPYPSYLDFDTFFAENADQFHLDNAYQAIYGYNGEASDQWVILNSATGSEYLIAPGQGFFVVSRPGGGNVQFLPSMRRPGKSDDFIEGRAASTNKALSKLKLTRAATEVSTASIYFIEGTTRGLDPGYDAAAYAATKVNLSLFTNLLEDNRGMDIAIQSLPYEDYNDVTVPLGIKAKAAAELSIGIDDQSTIPENINVYLEDTQNNTLTLLNADDFTFTPTEDIDGAGRFNIHYSARTLSIADMDVNANLRIYTTIEPKTVVVSGQLTSATTAHLYDIQGRLVLSKALNTHTTQNILDVSSLNTGVYVIKLNNSNQFKTQKLVIK